MSGEQPCRELADFEHASEILGRNPNLTFTMELSMAEDGMKHVSCVLSAEAKQGWAQILERTGDVGWAIGNCQ